MTRKNPFYYVGFLKADGTLRLTQAQLLASFEQDVVMGIMDYGNPNAEFTGRISIEGMSAEDLNRAILAFDQFHEFSNYPPGYRESLVRARSDGLNPGEFELHLTLG